MLYFVIAGDENTAYVKGLVIILCTAGLMFSGFIWLLDEVKLPEAMSCLVDFQTVFEHSAMSQHGHFESRGL